MIHHLLPQRKRKGEISFSFTKINSENYKSIAKILAKAGDRTLTQNFVKNHTSVLAIFRVPPGRGKIVKLKIKTKTENLKLCEGPIPSLNHVFLPHPIASKNGTQACMGPDPELGLHKWLQRQTCQICRSNKKAWNPPVVAPNGAICSKLWP